MKGSVVVLVTAIVSLATLEIVAMLKGLDGYLFSIIVMGIAGIAGFKLPNILKRFGKK